MELEKRSLIWRQLNCEDIEKQARREQIRMLVGSFITAVTMFSGYALGMKGNSPLFLLIIGLVLFLGNAIMLEIKMSMFKILKELRKSKQS